MNPHAAGFAGIADGHRLRGVAFAATNRHGVGVFVTIRDAGRLPLPVGIVRLCTREVESGIGRRRANSSRHESCLTLAGVIAGVAGE